MSTPGVVDPERLAGVADATLAAELAGERRPDAIAADPAAVLALLETRISL